MKIEKIILIFHYDQIEQRNQYFELSFSFFAIIKLMIFLM